jgi:DNA repair exonuclease SbcCD ATPase subunit
MGEQYAAELEAAVKEKATLEGKLASADALLSQERKRAATQAEELRQAHETLEQYEKSGGRRNAGAVKVATERMRAEYGDKMQEMAQEKTNLVAQLENASATIEDERQRFAALNEQLSQAQAEIQKLEKQLSGSAGGSSDNAPVSQDDFAAQLQALTQEKASLIEQLERANASVAQERNLAAAVTEELRRARHKAQRGGAARDSGNAETESQSQYLEKMQEISTEKDALAGQLEKANRLLEEERQRFETLNEEVRRSRLETDQLERRLTEGGAGVDSEVIDQLRSQYAAKLEEIAQEKTDLAGRLEQASALLAQERQRFANASNGGSGSVDHAAIEQEVARVEGAIAEITQFIDDPSAQLAAVIRKNVERAELDAYLKGILFARGEMKGVC